MAKLLGWQDTEEILNGLKFRKAQSEGSFIHSFKRNKEIYQWIVQKIVKAD